MSQEKYIQLNIPVSPEKAQLLVALLSDIGFEGFEDAVDELKAFIPERDFDAGTLEDRLSMLSIKIDKIHIQEIEPQNWNAVWESNYDSIEIPPVCRLRATFHQVHESMEQREDRSIKYEVLIDPKMSFGTGHHETTRLMILHMDQLDFSEKEVLDMGCGTSVLGILAHKMGAKAVTGIDIDQWSFENSTENANLNKVRNLRLIRGDAHSIPDLSYDIILANINTNVLKTDASVYIHHLTTGGFIVLSGFYHFDLDGISKLYHDLGCKTISEIQENEWMSIILKKEI